MNDFLQQQVERLTKELTAWQSRFGSIKEWNEEREKVIQDASLLPSLPSWSNDETIMTPLIVAYDLKILELTNFADDQKSLICKLRDQLVSLQSDNESLRIQQFQHLQSLTENVAGYTVGGNILGSDNLALEHQCQRLQILSDENNALIEHVGNLTTDFNECQTQLEIQNSECAELEEALKQLITHNRELKSNIEITFGAKSIAEKSIIEEQNKRASLEVSLDVLSRDFDDCKGSLDRSRAECKQMKYDLESNEREWETKFHDSVHQLHAFKTRIDELEQQYNEVSSNLDGSHGESRRLISELEVAKSDAAGILQVMTSYENQKVELQSKVDVLESHVQELRSEYQSACLARDALKTSEEALIGQVHRLKKERNGDRTRNDNLRANIIQETRDLFSDRLKKQAIETDQAYKELGQVSQTNDRLMRERSEVDACKKRLEDQLEGFRRDWLSRLSLMEQQIMASDKRKVELEAVVDQYTSELELIRSDALNQSSSLQAENGRNQAEIKKLWDAMDDKDKNIDRLEQELAQDRRKSTQTIDLARRKLETELTSSRNNLAILQDDYQKLNNRYDECVSQSQFAVASTHNQMDAKIRNLSASLDSAQQYAAGYETQISSLQLQVRTSKGRSKKLTMMCKERDCKLRDLTETVTEMLEQRRQDENLDTFKFDNEEKNE